MANPRTRVGALVALALVIAAVVTWYLASPGWTLRQMKAAADANDPDALNAYIDYPALRADLKAEVKGQMMAEAQKDRSGLRGLGLTIGTAMVGPMIDRLITPAGMRAAFATKRDEELIQAAPQAASALHVPNAPDRSPRTL